PGGDQVLQHRNQERDDRTAGAARSDLRHQRAKVGGTVEIGQRGQQRLEKLTSNDPANATGDAVARRTEIEVAARMAQAVAAKSASDRLNDQGHDIAHPLRLNRLAATRPRRARRTPVSSCKSPKRSA